MHLRFLDENFESISSVINDYTTFIWSEQWGGIGTFIIKMPERHFPNADAAAYIYSKSMDNCGIITEISRNAEGVTVTGVLLESVLSDKIINAEMLLNDTLENALYSVVTTYALTGDRTIPLLELAPQSGFDEVYEGIAEEGKNVQEWLYKVLGAFEMSYQIKFDYDNRKLIFSIKKGLDRTQEQDINTWATFSDRFGNVQNISYDKKKNDYKNYAYVVGEYNKTRVVEEIDGRSDITEPRKETYIKPSISSEDNITSVGQLRTILRQRGAEALAEYKIIENITAEANNHASLKYGENYNLGDLCNVIANIKTSEKPEEYIRMMWKLRITSVEHAFKDDGDTIIPGFGEGMLSQRKYIARELRNGRR